MIVIFDLDGTLANVEESQKRFISGKNIADVNWEQFYRACCKAEPIREIVELCKLLGNYPDIDIHVWTARGKGPNDINEILTKNWLIKNGITKFKLKMRDFGDGREDVDIKASWLEAMKINGQWPDLVFDDRKRVVDMWRNRGIMCCQVAEGDF